jgi:hypothetical protein
LTPAVRRRLSGAGLGDDDLGLNFNLGLNRDLDFNRRRPPPR